MKINFFEGMVINNPVKIKELFLLKINQ